MRRSLGEGWSIQLLEEWRQGRTKSGVVTWLAPGKSVRAYPGAEYRCATTLDVLADIERELPRNPTGKVSEGGNNGIGVRAAWFYRDPGEGLRYVLLGYSFTGTDSARYLETQFRSEATEDAEWAFCAWRSMAHDS